MDLQSSLAGYSALVTAGATLERIDPVRYLSNFSSGKQGYAIASALAERGAAVTLVAGVTMLSAPTGVRVIRVESAANMLRVCQELLPVDIVVCAAAVCDWRVEVVACKKIKKPQGQERLTLELVKNPDILATICKHSRRPRLVIGFAAETENLLEQAAEKQEIKGCDWIVANIVGENSEVFGADKNEVWIQTPEQTIHIPRTSKVQIGKKLTDLIVEYFSS